MNRVVKPDPILEVSDLSVAAFPHNHTPIPILNDVHLSVHRGETVCVIGQSGSGKSTLAYAIAGLFPSPNVRKTQGCIKVFGQQLTPESTPTLLGRTLGMIFQDPWATLTPVYRCGDQVVELLQIHRGLNRTAARAETLRLFHHVGFSDPEGVYRRFPHELSGGMCQRIGITMAIAPQPGLLIADEPTTALDPTVADAIITLLQTLQTESGLGILLATHDLTVVSRMADYVVVLQTGVVVEHGSFDQVFSAPQHPYTIKLMDDFGNFATRPPLANTLKA